MVQLATFNQQLLSNNMAPTTIRLRLLASISAMLFFAISVYGQSILQPHFVPLQGSRNYDDIRTVLPDSKGFLWFGCNQGLVRFDGKVYHRFEPGNNNQTIASDAVTTLCEAADGAIWIGTADKGLYSYHYNTDTFTAHSFNTKSTAIFSIDKYNDGVVISTASGVFIVDKSNKASQLKFADSLLKNNFIVVKTVPDATVKNVLWMLASTGLYSYDTNTTTLKKWHGNGFSIDEIGNALTTLVATADGKIYSATKSKGLVELDIATGKITQHIFSKNSTAAYSSNNIDALLRYDDNNLLAATQDSGLAVFNKAENRFAFLRQDNFSETNFFRFQAKAFGTNSENVVMATQHDGIWVFNKASQLFHTVTVPSKYNTVPGTLYTRSIYASPEGKVYAGSYFGDGLYVFNSAEGAVQSYPFLQKNGSTLIINAIFRDHHGITWLASHENGVLIFDEAKQKLIPAADNYPAFKNCVAQKIYCFHEDKQNNLYIATGDAGLFKVDAARQHMTNYGHNDKDSTSILSNNLFAEKIFEDSKGRLWLSARAGITVLETASQKFYHFTNEQGKYNSLPASFWYPVEQDNSGNIYIGTGDGMFKINADDKTLATAKHFTEKEGLQHNAVFSFVKDKQGMLWITCRSGLSCFDPVKNSFANFNYKNGLPAKTLMAPMQIAADGNIYHGAVEKYFSFQPQQLLKQKSTTDVWFTAFKIFDKDSISSLSLNTIKQLNLSYQQNSFSFSFVSPSVFYPDAIVYAYMLEGFDKEWKQAGSRNYITYTNVGTGKYVLKIKSAGADGIWSDKIKTIEIIIAPPFWQSWWFRLLALLFAAGIGYAFIKRRERAAAEREAEKTEMEKLKAISYQYQLEIEQVTNYFATSIHEQDSIDDMLWDVAKNCISKLGFEDCVIYLKDEKRNVLVQKAAWGPKTTEENKIINPISILLGKGIVGNVALNNKAEVINDTTMDPRYIVDDAHRLSEICVPISTGNIVLGVLDSEHSKKNFYTQSHLKILTTIASLLANRIEKIAAENTTRQKELELLTIKNNSYQYQLEVEKIISFFATSISTHASVDDILWDISENLIGQLGFEECMIYLWNDDKTILMQRAGHGLKGDMAVEMNKSVYNVPRGKGIVGATAEAGECILVHDTSKDSRYFSADVKIMFSELCVPIIQKNEVIGVINTEHSKKNFFTEKHVNILSTIASLCADKMDKLLTEQKGRQKEMEVLKLNKDLATWQITALRAQMNPHFIFNAMNSIQQFTLKNDTDNANLYISKFSALLRKVLHTSQQSLISLEEEAEQLGLYLEIEKLRMGNDFVFAITIDVEIEADALQMPGMLVQPFVENAIKHGLPLRQGEKRLTIHFSMPDEFHLSVVVTDNGIGRREAEELKKQQTLLPHESKGIELVKHRLRLLEQDKQHNGDVVIEDLPDNSGTKVILLIPV